MSGKTFEHSLMLLTISFALTAFCACSSSNQTSNQTRPVPTPRTIFERDLQYIKGGGWAHIYVIARQDGSALDKEDAAYLRENIPKAGDTITTDEGRRAIVGTNFDFTPENMDALRKRFIVEDYTRK